MVYFCSTLEGGSQMPMRSTYISPIHSAFSIYLSGTLFPYSICVKDSLFHREIFNCLKTKLYSFPPFYGESWSYTAGLSGPMSLSPDVLICRYTWQWQNSLGGVTNKPSKGSSTNDKENKRISPLIQRENQWYQRDTVALQYLDPGPFNCGSAMPSNNQF